MVTQNKILKIFQFKKHISNTSALYKEYSVLKVEDQHECNICCLIHNIIHHPVNIPTSMNELLILHIRICTSRIPEIKMISMPHINNMTYGSRKLNHSGRNFWNNLPTALKQEPSTNTFKDKLTKTTLYFDILAWFWSYQRTSCDNT